MVSTVSLMLSSVATLEASRYSIARMSTDAPTFEKQHCQSKTSYITIADHKAHAQAFHLERLGEPEVCPAIVRPEVSCTFAIRNRTLVMLNVAIQ